MSEQEQRTPDAMSKHTAGPWSCERIWDTPACRIHARIDGGVPVALAEVFTMRGSGEKEANAKLIAAAPDLLEALRELLESHSVPYPPYEGGQDAQDAWSHRRAAARDVAAAVIAKATGAA